ACAPGAGNIGPANARSSPRTPSPARQARRCPDNKRRRAYALQTRAVASKKRPLIILSGSPGCAAFAGLDAITLQRREAMLAIINSRNALAVLLLAFAAIVSSPASAQSTLFDITILSSRVDTVSGGDALAQVRVPASTPQSDVFVRLNGRDVTSGFRSV